MIFNYNKIKKISLLHFIKTTKNEYCIYNTEPNEKGYNCSVLITTIKENKPLLYKEIMEEYSSSCYGGMSFTNYVNHCLYELRIYLIKNKEFIIEDRII